MKKIIFLGLIVIFLFSGCTSKSSQIVINECKVCNTNACKVNMDCVYEKMSSELDCKILEGQTKTEVYFPIPKDIQVDDDDIAKCFQYWAIKKNDPDICNNSVKANSCFIGVAVEKNDFLICNKSHEKDSCFLSFATTKNNPNACEQISTPRSRLDCNITFSVREMCEKEVSSRSLDRLSCMLKKIKAEKNYLFDSNYGLKKTLEKIGNSNQPFEEGRFEAALAVYTENPELCEKSGNIKSECYYDLAKSSLSVNLSICEKAGTAYIPCYRGVAIREKDATICTEYIPDSFKDNCYKEVALAAKSIEICSQMASGTDAGYCASSLSGQICNPPNCNFTLTDCQSLKKIQEKGASRTFANPDKCYYEVGVRDIDKNACNQISESKAKQECLDIIAHS